MANVPEQISEDTLKLLYTLFISNLPQTVKNEINANFVRIFHELEYAYWYYLDNCVKDKNSAVVDLYGFCQKFFERFPHLKPNNSPWTVKWEEWRLYRGGIETASAIILDEYLSMVLLVQGFNNDQWTFPGGKINQNETASSAAIREVMEETGLDIEHRLNDSLFLKACTRETQRRAYIIEGFPRLNRLEPSTRNEIEAITWFSLDKLPCGLQDNTPMMTMRLKPNIFFCVAPFVKQLREYVRLRKLGQSQLVALASSASAVGTEGLSQQGPPGVAGGNFAKHPQTAAVLPKLRGSASFSTYATMEPSSPVNRTVSRDRQTTTPPKTTRRSKQRRAISTKSTSVSVAMSPQAPLLMTNPLLNLRPLMGSPVGMVRPLWMPPHAHSSSSPVGQPRLPHVPRPNNQKSSILGPPRQSPSKTVEKRSKPVARAPKVSAPPPSNNRTLFRINTAVHKKNIYGGQVSMDPEVLLDLFAPRLWAPPDASPLGVRWMR